MRFPVFLVPVGLALLAGSAIRAAAGAGAAAVEPAHAAALQPAVSPPQPRPDPLSEPRFEGEYGLWVRQAGRDLEVRWLTREPEAGHLEVRSGDRVAHAVVTPAAQAHSAVFRRPRGRALTLRYGSASAAQHAQETTIYPGTPRRAGSVFSNVDSVFVVGDVHGEFDTLIGVLRNAGVIDDRLRWRAGRGHLVLLGDLFDRGPDVTRLLWFVYDLERQAEQARGRVHTVLGNHEIMVMKGDLRYVAPKESLIAHLHGTSYDRMFDPRHSVLGRWLASKPAILRINDVLYAHGGVSSEYARVTLREYDEILDRFMKEDLFYRWADTTAAVGMSIDQVRIRENFFWGEGSAFWFRGYVESEGFADQLAGVLRHFRSSLHVVAHTPVEAITERYAGSLIAVNVAKPASELLLLVREGRQTRRYRVGLTGPPAPLAASTTSLGTPYIRVTASEGRPRLVSERDRSSGSQRYPRRRPASSGGADPAPAGRPSP